jgi:chemotaxis signal transduction protein
MSDDEASEFDFSVEEIDDLAREPQTSALKFRVGPLHLAVEADFVMQVLTQVNVTPLPGVPDYIVGAFVSRGTACAVVDLCKWFWLDAPPSEFTVVLRLGDWQVGIWADEIEGIAPFRDDTDREAEKKLNARVSSYSRSAHWEPGGVVALLNVEKLLMEMALHIERKGS